MVLNSFGVPSRARYFASVGTVEELSYALEFAAQQKLRIHVLGGGSNTLFVGDFSGLVLHTNLHGREVDTGSGEVLLAAGENWHQAVIHCLNKDLYGLENLALIPGNTGAAPIQNIGAYGVELTRFFQQAEALNRNTGERRTFNRAACQFGYRDSLFKRVANPWIILSLSLRLNTEPAPEYSYPALAKALAEQPAQPPATGKSQHARATPDTTPTPQAIFDAVCHIRRSKLPDPARLGNAGSFFRNPLVSGKQFAELKAAHPELPSFPASAGKPADKSANEKDEQLKIPAGWLLEQLGWKGQRKGQAGVHEQHALVLVNHGGATGEDILTLARDMQTSVQDRFSINLEPEISIVTNHDG